MFGEFFDKYRWWAIFGVVAFILGTVWLWQGKASQISSNNAQISEMQSQIQGYAVLIQREGSIRTRYVTLAQKYILNEPDVAGVEGDFTSYLANVCKTTGATFVGINYGVVNGSQPPAPVPHLDTNGAQAPFPTPVPQQTEGPRTSNLGGAGPGDPDNGRPNIPTSIFVRIPATVKLTGTWRQITAAIQAFSQGKVLVATNNPIITEDKGNLTVTVILQLLHPAVEILPDLMPKKNTIIHTKNNTTKSTHTNLIKVVTAPVGHFVVTPKPKESPKVTPRPTSSPLRNNLPPLVHSQSPLSFMSDTKPKLAFHFDPPLKIMHHINKRIRSIQP